MKIISKYKDYYDAGLIYGIDEKQYFKREQKREKIEIDFIGEYFSFKNGEYIYEITVFPLLIGFCESIYPLYKIKINTIFQQRATLREEFVYTYESFVEVCESIGCRVETSQSKGYFFRESNTKQELMYKNEYLQISLESKYLFLNSLKDEWRERGNIEKYAEYIEIFSKRKVAYFVVGVHDMQLDENKYGYAEQTWVSSITVYPILKDYKFSQIKDAYTAFQEISMFLGNMNNLDDILQKTDDKYVAYSKGFCSHSFKKKPTKNKEKPCDTKMSIE